MQMNSSSFASACFIQLCDAACPRRQRTQDYTPRRQKVRKTPRFGHGTKGQNRTMHAGKTLHRRRCRCQAYLYITRSGIVSVQGHFFPAETARVCGIIFKLKTETKGQIDEFYLSRPALQFSAASLLCARDNIPFAGVIVVGTKTHTSRYVEQQRTSLQLSLRR